MGVLQFVADDKEGGLAPLLCPLEQVFHCGVFLHCGHCHHPLVVGPAAQVFQFFGVRLFDGGPGLFGFGDQRLQPAGAFAPLDVKAVNGPSGFERLGYRVASGDDVCAPGGFPAIVWVFFHGESSFCGPAHWRGPGYSPGDRHTLLTL